MAFQVFLCFLLLALAWLGRAYGLRPGHAHWRAAAPHSVVHRLLKPRTPRDCPVCYHSSTCTTGAGPSPLPVRPWGEVKSRRGAPRRVNTEGFACPNQQCWYFGITDAHIHALVGDGKHGHAERIQTFRCQACRATCSARRDTPLYRLKTPSHQSAVVLSALAEGLDPSAAERVFGYRQATITRLSVPRGLACSDVTRTHLLRPPAPASPTGPLLRTRLRSSKHVVWLWLAIDPCTKIVPVLHLGPRTQHMAHLVIHSLQQLLAAFLPPPLYQ